MDGYESILYLRIFMSMKFIKNIKMSWIIFSMFYIEINLGIKKLYHAYFNLGQRAHMEDQRSICRYWQIYAHRRFDSSADASSYIIMEFDVEGL